MDAIFVLGNRASVEDIRARLIDAPSYSATRTMVTRLEEKGFVRHEADGNRYLYSATVSPAAAKREGLQRFLGVFFEGSRPSASRTSCGRARRVSDCVQHSLNQSPRP